MVPFLAEKITVALNKAGNASGEFSHDIAQQPTNRVLSILATLLTNNQEAPGGDDGAMYRSPSTPPTKMGVPNCTSLLTAERVQDIVEDVLLSSPFRRTAKAYILYRERHAEQRSLIQQLRGNLVSHFLDRSDWRVKENSNMGYSLQGLNQFVSSRVSEAYWLHKVYNRQMRQAHDDGDIHIHDLGSVSPYCVGWDLLVLLTVGFRGASGKVESAPPRHFRSALGQMVNFLFTLQGEAAGAQAFSNVDTLLAPFIRADGLSFRDVKQCLQEFVFNLNVPTRVGFQTPFTNLTFDLTVPSYYEKQAAIIGGKPTDDCYGDFGTEMEMLNKAFLEVLGAGDASGRVFSFPIPTYNITPNFDWDRPSLAPLWRLTAKYGVPYFANFINSDMNPEDARSMCCRLHIDNREIRKRLEGIFAAAPLTGSIGVVTINLPRLGHTATSIPTFFEKLSGLLRLAYQSLEEKRKGLESFTSDGLYPYLKFYLRNTKGRTNFTKRPPRFSRQSRNSSVCPQARHQRQSPQHAKAAP